MDSYIKYSHEIARQAGEIMKEYFYQDIEIRLKEDQTPVTDADEKINRLVIDSVKDSFPAHGVLGEEEKYNTDAEYLWVTDPIDGTIPFTLGIPTNVFSIALVINGDPVLGIIYDPYLNRLYSAVKDHGAFVNDKLLITSSKTDLDLAYIGISTRKGSLKNNELYDIFSNKKSRLPKYFSTTYSLAQVAAGKFEGEVFSHNTPWDVAAAKIIIEEAGGVTSDMSGKPQKYNSEIYGFLAAGNKQLHDQMISIIKNSL